MSSFAAQLNKLKRAAVDGKAASSTGNNQKRTRTDIQTNIPSALTQQLLDLPNKLRVNENNNTNNKSLKYHAPIEITILFITIDELPHEDIWKKWKSHFTTDNNSTSVKVNILCHAKYPHKVRSEWLQQYLLSKTYRPEWGSVEITKAMIYLLESGLRKYPGTTHFLFASETCIPIVSLSTLAQILTNDNCYSYSWVNAVNRPNNGYSKQQQWDRIDRSVPSNLIHKADQWVLLKKEHAATVLKIDRYLDRNFYKFFSRVRASDEMYFPTALACAGLLTTATTATTGSTNLSDVSNDDKLLLVGNNILKRRLTYCDWSGGVNLKNPKAFTDKDLKQVVSLARSEGCLFARKFDDCHIPVDQWSQIVLGCSNSSNQNDVPHDEDNALK